MAGRQGLEPRYADPESAVLPLDDLPRAHSQYNKHSSCSEDARAKEGTRARVSFLFLECVVVRIHYWYGQDSRDREASITFAIDVGGTGIKGILLDDRGKPMSERIRLETPQPATPEKVLAVMDRYLGKAERL